MPPVRGHSCRMKAACSCQHLSQHAHLLCGPRRRLVARPTAPLLHRASCDCFPPVHTHTEAPMGPSPLPHLLTHPPARPPARPPNPPHLVSPTWCSESRFCFTRSSTYAVSFRSSSSRLVLCGGSDANGSGCLPLSSGSAEARAGTWAGALRGQWWMKCGAVQTAARLRQY